MALILLGESRDNQNRYTISTDHMDRTGRTTPLETLRTARGWSQVTLAKRARVSDMTISKIERGQVHPLHRTWARLAKALDTTVDQLLGRAPHEPPDPLTDRLLTLWRALPADQRPAGIEALEYVVMFAAEVQRLRAEVATHEQQARNDAARIRDDKRLVRALEREVRTLRRASTRSQTSTAEGQTSGTPTRQAG